MKWLSTLLAGLSTPSLEDKLEARIARSAVVSDVDAASIANWQRLPLGLRERMLADLRVWIGGHVLAGWKLQGLPPMWHFDGGMQVRNRLRTHLRDVGLPPVRYEDGHEAQNWDDYYMGAVHELLGEV